MGTISVNVIVGNQQRTVTAAFVEDEGGGGTVSTREMGNAAHALAAQFKAEGISEAQIVRGSQIIVREQTSGTAGAEVDTQAVAALFNSYGVRLFATAGEIASPAPPPPAPVRTAPPTPPRPEGLPDDLAGTGQTWSRLDPPQNKRPEDAGCYEYWRAEPEGTLARVRTGECAPAEISWDDGANWFPLLPPASQAAPATATAPTPASQTFRDRGRSITVNPLTGSSRYMQDGSDRYEVFQTSGESPVRYRRKVNAQGTPITNTPWQRCRPGRGGTADTWSNVSPNASSRQSGSSTTRRPTAGPNYGF